MEKYKYKSGFQKGKFSRVCPGIGMVTLDDKITDEIAKAFVDGGIKDVFELVIKEPKAISVKPKKAIKPKPNGKEKGTDGDNTVV